MREHEYTPDRTHLRVARGFGRGEVLDIPVKLLDALDALGISNYELEEARAFHRIAKRSLDLRQVQAKDLLDEPTDDTLFIRFFVPNWEDSEWVTIPFPGAVKDDRYENFIVLPGTDYGDDDDIDDFDEDDDERWTPTRIIDAESWVQLFHLKPDAVGDFI